MNVFRKNRTQSYSQASPSSSSSPSDQPTTRVSSIIPLEPSAFANTAPPAADSRPVASRSTSEAVPATQSRDVTGLPSYAPRPAALAVPSYYDAQMQSPVEGAVRRASFLSPGDGQRLVRDYFASPPPIRQDGGVEEGEEEDGDDPLVPRALRPLPQPSLLPLRRATLPVLFRHEPPPPLEAPNGSEAPLQLPIELPPPPANALPAYNAHLAHDELRLISSVHLDQNHPAAAFFSAMTSSVNRADQPENQGLQAEEMSTGGKKLRLTITRGGQRMNDNGTGPIFIRLGRGGVVEGRIDVGKVDHVIGLEASILGLVNTSYYVRGQYTLIDTMPLARRRAVLWPPETPQTASSASEWPSNSTSAQVPPLPQGSILSPTTTTSPENVDHFASDSPATNGKEPQVFMIPGQTFSFSLKIPAHHYRDEDFELPPSCQVFQVGLQAGVEYVLRVKLSRKGWRLNETLSVPIIYEPRAYLPPRRLRQLTTSDALNPGWRTIRLTGGSPVKDTTPPSPGVEVTLLLPSPPILFVAHDGIPPPIPFHLHFHSPVTLPLATFSDPRQSTFVIRLMRVTMIRISTEKEIRRMELKSKIEVWQEGSPRITLGEERPVGGTHGANGTGRQYSSHAAATPVTGATGRRPSTSGGERRRSFSERRSSFLRRRPSTEPAALEPEPTPVTQSNGPTIPPITEEPQEELPPSASPDERIAPLPLDATDVHLMGQLTISPSTSGGSMTALRTLVQSFTTPEISISYVLEVGLQPKKGAVREAFSHVWGGGLVEVVLGAR